MLVRLLIYVVLGIVLYRAARLLFGRVESGPLSGRGDPREQVDDVMIKDPVCGTYFPQRQAVILNGKRRTMYFCSHECRDRYLAANS